MDIYSEKLLPPPAVPSLDISGLSLDNPSDGQVDSKASLVFQNKPDKFPTLPSVPLGLAKSSAEGSRKLGKVPTRPKLNGTGGSTLTSGPTSPDKSRGSTGGSRGELPASYEATSLPLNDRLAARDRAYGLLSGLTKLGSSWNYSEAWFALARAYEESGQVDKAKDALWWCVELEDGMGVREWTCLGAGGYVL